MLCRQIRVFLRLHVFDVGSICILFIPYTGPYLFYCSLFSLLLNVLIVCLLHIFCDVLNYWIQNACACASVCARHYSLHSPPLTVVYLFILPIIRDRNFWIVRWIGSWIRSNIKDFVHIDRRGAWLSPHQYHYSVIFAYKRRNKWKILTRLRWESIGIILWYWPSKSFKSKLFLDSVDDLLDFRPLEKQISKTSKCTRIFEVYLFDHNGNCTVCIIQSVLLQLNNLFFGVFGDGKMRGDHKQEQKRIEKE